MKVLKPAAGIGAGIGAVLLYGVIAGDIVVQSDPGGNVVALYTQYYNEWQDGHRHRIDGLCASACTMRLAFEMPAPGAQSDNRTCITPTGRLGFHRAFYVSLFGWKLGSPWGTRYMLDRYPTRVRNWIEPRISHNMTWLDADGAIRLGVLAC
jgi:hypothetical protein